MHDAIGIIDLESEVSMPVWSVTHTVETFSSNYLKLQSIRQMCKLFQHGAYDEDFLIAVNSFDLYPASDDLHYRNKDLVVLQSKADSAQGFWQLFKRLHRPIILTRTGQQFRPLYELESEQALRVPGLSVESAFSVSLQGAIGTLIDLFTGRAGAARDNEHLEASLNNIRNIVETSQLIEDPQTPEGVRHFAVDQVEAIINKQAQVNKKLGIRCLRFRPPQQTDS